MIESLPVSTSLLKAVTYQLNHIDNLLVQSSSDYNSFYSILHSVQDLAIETSFIANPKQVTFVQTSMLLVLSMVGGVLVPVINSFTEEDGVVRISWDNGTLDTFTFGKVDDDFLRFFTYFQNRLSSKPQLTTAFPPVVLFGIQQFLKNYVEILMAVRKRIVLLSKSKQEVLSLFNNEVNRDLLFILISSLPTDQINTFFLHVQQFFPEDLEAKTADGKSINVISFFQNSSTDIIYLVEKIKIYLDLYFKKDMPIIKEITRTKTVSFMKELLINDEVYKQISRNLFQIDKVHIDVRLKLYSLFIGFFDTLELKKL
ncbi:MAG: hypothetical protein CMP39_06940 [Rickettsiales bacterium]|nr:hypothetical protein [Rickettsiales bacterium]|tara:strand:- start:2453 stop:3394 length:942 start_codon:yes stop_codon:yes gene_type:complete